MTTFPADKIKALFPGRDPAEIGPLDIQLALLEAVREMVVCMKSPFLAIDKDGNVKRI